MAGRYRVGDPVIYRKQKFSRCPSRNAVAIDPTPGGDDYSYCIDKYWRVIAVLPDDTVRICTRRGKEHTVSVSDPALRPAHWWERLLYRRRFPTPLA